MKEEIGKSAAFKWEKRTNSFLWKMGIDTFRVLMEACIRVPEDVSVVGDDGLVLRDYFHPRLTTMKQSTRSIALATVDLLFDILAGNRGHKYLIHPGELIVREYTAAPQEN